MADIKQYLDREGLSVVIDEVKAGDAATLQSAKDYSDSLASNYDSVGSANQAETNTKAYTDTKVNELADGQVKTNTDAIAKLNGDATVDGSVAKAIADAKALIDADVDAVESKADQNATDIAAINNAETGILKQNKDYTDTKVGELKTEVDAHEEYVGTIPEGSTATTIVGWVEERTSGIATDAALGELQTAVTGVQEDVATIKGDYLKAADKTELQGNIDKAQTAADAAQEHSEGVAADLAEEVTARTEADEAQAARIKTLEDQIVGLSGCMHFEGVKDEVPTDVTGYENGDVIIVGNKEYVLNNGAFVEFGDVSAQAEAITTLTGRVDGHDTAIGAIETNIDEVEAAVAQKADKTALETEVAERKAADTALDERVQALEGAVGESGSVSEDIATAKQEAITAAAEDATTKADAALEAAKKYADEEDAKIESRVDALEADTHTHANKALLDTYTQTEENLADAVAKKHEHINKEVLDGITAEKVAVWDAAEKNARDYADGLNTTMTSKVDAIDARLVTAEAAVATKAEASTVTAIDERLVTAEAAIAANTSAINSFAPIATTDIQAMFA